MVAMTTLFVSHGAPTLALEPGKTGQALAALASELERPAAILVISAHWDTAQPQVSLATTPETIHDFYGFPKPLYGMEYPAPGAPALGRKVAGLLQQADIAVTLDASRGLDHGAWVPLMMMYPEADIPVTQLSMQGQAGPAAHYALGQALRALHADKVLILCSGAITHNLRDFSGGSRDQAVLDYVSLFSDWMAGRIVEQDIESLLDYRQRCPQGVRAHPQDDHLLPLFVGLGSGQGVPRRIQPETTYGLLAMDIYVWDAAH